MDWAGTLTCKQYHLQAEEVGEEDKRGKFAPQFAPPLRAFGLRYVAVLWRQIFRASDLATEDEASNYVLVKRKWLYTARSIKIVLNKFNLLYNLISKSCRRVTNNS
jgi:hypothetical protein